MTGVIAAIISIPAICYGIAIPSLSVFQPETLNHPSGIRRETIRKPAAKDPAAVAVLKDQLRLHQARQRQLEESARHPIVHVAMEMAPFSKKGGLADVAGALPKELAKLGYKNILIMPRYPAIEEKYPLKYTGIQFVVPVGDEFIPIKVKTTDIDGVTVYFLENGIHFPEPYKQKGRESLEESVLLSRGALELIQRLGIQPSVVHSHDWHTALVPVYQKTLYAEHFKNTLAHFTIHNALYQGDFESEFFPLTGLPGWVDSVNGVEFWGHINLMKGGVLFADTVNTVSPTYRKETLSRDAFGFEGVLARKENWYQGILNGIDTESWNPATDSALEYQYTVDTVSEIRPLNKEQLQRDSGLLINPRVPLFGFVGRLDSQKGVDLLIEGIRAVLEKYPSTQWVILGSEPDPEEGKAKVYEPALQRLMEEYPGRVAAMLTFNEPLSRRIYAGADFLVVPSRFEPCGLVQQYAMHYGSIPIVHGTGGLEDTVEDANVYLGTGTGIKFGLLSKNNLIQAIQKALKLYQSESKRTKVIQNGMKKDLGWQRGTTLYLDMYQRGLREFHDVTMADLTREPQVVNPDFERRLSQAMGLKQNPGQEFSLELVSSPSFLSRAAQAFGRKGDIAEYGYHYPDQTALESIVSHGLTNRFLVARVGFDNNPGAIFFWNHIKSGVASGNINGILLRVPKRMLKPAFEVGNNLRDGTADYWGWDILPDFVEVVNPRDPSVGIPVTLFDRASLKVPAHFEEQRDLVVRFTRIRGKMAQTLDKEKGLTQEEFQRWIENLRYGYEGYAHYHHPKLAKLSKEQQELYYTLTRHLLKNRSNGQFKPLDKTSLVEFVRETETYTQMDLYVRILEGMFLSGIETMNELLQSSEPAVQPLVRYLKFLKQEVNEPAADQQQIEAAVLGAI